MNNNTNFFVKSSYVKITISGFKKEVLEKLKLTDNLILARTNIG